MLVIVSEFESVVRVFIICVYVCVAAHELALGLCKDVLVSVDRLNVS